MSDIEKSPDSPKRDGSQSVDAFARLRATMKKMSSSNGNSVVKGGKLFLVIDGSSSMNAYCSTRGAASAPKYEAVRRVVTDIQTKYVGRVSIEIIEFTTTAQQLTDLSQYPTGGGTHILPALQLLQTPGSQVVLLSDGDSMGHDEIIADLPRLKAQKIVVNCIGVGVSSTGRALLQAIADGTGGSYVGIEADLQLIFNTFSALASKAVAALTAGQGAITMGGGEVR